MDPTGLSAYLIKLKDIYADQRRNLVEPKWNANLNLVNNQDARMKTWKKGEKEDWRSDAFIGITKAKVFVAYAMLIEVFLQGGELQFHLSPSEVIEDLPEETQRQIELRVDGMTGLIRDQHKARHADRRHMKHFLSKLIYGMTCSKYDVEMIQEEGFRPVNYGENSEYLQNPGDFEGFEFYQESKPVPGHSYVSMWSILWDMEVDDQQTGRGLFEHIPVSPYELRGNMGQPYFLDEKIQQVISEYTKSVELSNRESLPPAQRELKHREKEIERFEFWGRAPRKLVEQFETDENLGRNEDDDIAVDFDVVDAERSGDDVEIMAQVAGDCIVRYKRREPKQRPYRISVWEEEIEKSVGISVPDNMEGIAYSLNGFVRGFIDNKALSGNTILAIKRMFLQKPGQLDIIKPGMHLDIDESCDDARRAVSQIIIQDVGESYLSGIGLMERWGDTVSLLPNILQGHTLPKHAPDTAYEMSKLLEQAGKYLGMGIWNHDEGQVEPEIKDLYNFNMKDPNVPMEKKIPVKVHPGGFSGFQDRIVRVQKIKELLGMVAGSEVLLEEVKIKPHLDAIYKGMDLDPEEFLKSEEEKAEESQARQQMEEEARMKAEDAIRKEREIEMEAKIEELRAESLLDREESEEDFQREVILEGMKEDHEESQEDREDARNRRE